MSRLFGSLLPLAGGLGRSPFLQPSSIFRFIFSIKSSAIHSVYPNKNTITNNNNSTMQEELLQMKALLETMRIEMAKILTKIDEFDILLHRLNLRLERLFRQLFGIERYKFQPEVYGRRRVRSCQGDDRFEFNRLSVGSRGPATGRTVCHRLKEVVRGAPLRTVNSWSLGVVVYKPVVAVVSGSLFVDGVITAVIVKRC